MHRLARALVCLLTLASGCDERIPTAEDASAEDDAGVDATLADTGCVVRDETIDPLPLLFECEAGSLCPAGVRCTELGECACPLGAAGDACEACAPGFVRAAERCVLERDGEADEWPNAHSRAASDPWIVVHHDDIRVLRPRVLVLDFVNPADPSRIAALIDEVIAGFREGSRPRGDEDPGAAPQLEYELVGIRDLRDGVLGRPPAPADWPYENSTLYPRRPEGEPGAWRLDYATFFEDGFAPRYGIEDPEMPGSFLPLCELAERGLVHELWIVGSGDVPDASAAEVLATSPIYGPTGNRRSGSSPCAGNGCFDADVPWCGRTLRIGFVNYNRGPGCYLHSQGHGMESSGRSFSMPAWSEWWLPFARFNLRRRHGLPFDDLYAVSCAEGEQPCLRWTGERDLEIRHAGETHAIDGFDPVCGDVHFPPNGQSHYDYARAEPVLSSCDRFGRELACGEERRTPVSAATWARYEELAPDCGGAFLVWWMQRMPAHGSGHAFADGRAMPSVWPFLFY